MATGEAEGAPKRKKKFKYDWVKGYSAKTPMEDGYKVVVQDPAQAYNPALEDDCVALDYLAATYACFQDIQFNPRTCKEGKIKIENFLENVSDKFIWWEMWAALQVIILGGSHQYIVEEIS